MNSSSAAKYLSDLQVKEYLLQAVTQAGIMDESIESALYQALLSVPLAEFFTSAQVVTLVSNNIIDPGYGVHMPALPTICRVMGLFKVTKGMRILELGCANGYTSAILCSLGAQVYSIEPVGLLGQQARKNLDRSVFQTVLVKGGSNDLRWSEYAPFDVVVAWRSLENLPLSLTEDMKEDGKIIAPIVQGSDTRLYIWQISSEIKTYQLEQLACGSLFV